MSLTETEAYTEYNEWLDSIYTPYNIGILEFYASNVLKELDPIAYQEGFNDWVDSENIEVEGY